MSIDERSDRIQFSKKNGTLDGFRDNEPYRLADYIIHLINYLVCERDKESL